MKSTDTEKISVISVFIVLSVGILGALLDAFLPGNPWFYGGIIVAGFLWFACVYFIELWLKSREKRRDRLKAEIKDEIQNTGEDTDE